MRLWSLVNSQEAMPWATLRYVSRGSCGEGGGKAIRGSAVIVLIVCPLRSLTVAVLITV